MKKLIFQDDTYIACAAKPGQVYSSARRLWVDAATDADYAAWRTADGAGEPERVPVSFSTVAEVRKYVLDTVPGALPGIQEALVLAVADLKALRDGQPLSTDPLVSLVKRMDNARALVPD